MKDLLLGNHESRKRLLCGQPRLNTWPYLKIPRRQGKKHIGHHFVQEVVESKIYVKPEEYFN